jgi:hypothetical protein
MYYFEILQKNVKAKLILLALCLLLPIKNLFLTVTGLNATQYVIPVVAIMEGGRRVEVNRGGGATPAGCAQDFHYQIDNLSFSGSYLTTGNSYYYGCRPRIDLKYNFGERVQVYVSKNNLINASLSRWSYQTAFFLRQIIYCVIISLIFLAWIISTLKRPLPWWLQVGNAHDESQR